MYFSIPEFHISKEVNRGILECCSLMYVPLEFLEGMPFGGKELLHRCVSRLPDADKVIVDALQVVDVDLQVVHRGASSAAHYHGGVMDGEVVH